MLLWEALTTNGSAAGTKPDLIQKTPIVAKRLPFDRRCAKITKSGKRCRGKIHHGSDYCPLHDPAIIAKRKASSGKPRRRRHPLSHLPDGYLRKLSNYAAAGNAMDRLYREVRLGVITPEMGRILFGILTRLMDTGLLENTKNIPRRIDRTRAARLRPKMEEILTRSEKLAWKKAVCNAPLCVPSKNAVQRDDEPRASLQPGEASRESRKPSGQQQVPRLKRPRDFSLQVAS